MNKRDYIKEIRQAEKELQELFEQEDALPQKTMVKLSNIETNCFCKNNLTNKYLKKR
tara:strand:+ start:429 stop:599 length:171 start_codon:yes stop_codon:yes gene_type:complete